MPCPHTPLLVAAIPPEGHQPSPNAHQRAVCQMAEARDAVATTCVLVAFVCEREGCCSHAADVVHR